MAIEMNENEYVAFASELLEDIQDSIRLMYMNNHKPSTNGAIVVMVSDDTESNSVNYIKEGTDSFDMLSESKKEKIKNVPDEHIYVMICWNGFFANFHLNKDEDKNNLSKVKIEDTNENEEKIVSDFYEYYHKVKKYDVDLSEADFVFNIDGNERTLGLIGLMSGAMIVDIMEGIETPESIMTIFYSFMYNKLRKIEMVNGMPTIKEENMLRNFNEVENFNFGFMGGALLEELNECLLPNCELDEDELINFKLDIQNFITVANNSAKLEFDKNTSSFDGMIGMANEIRNQANK